MSCGSLRCCKEQFLGAALVRLQAARQEGMGSKRSAYAPGAMLRLMVSLAALSLCCLCLAPVVRADWGTVHCETTAYSLDVATLNSTIDAFRGCMKYGICPWGSSCCQTNAFASQCTSFWSANKVNFYMCGSLRCDDCWWISDMWKQVVDTCAQDYGGVDRAAGYVSYDWSFGFWNKYGF